MDWIRARSGLESVHKTTKFFYFLELYRLREVYEDFVAANFRGEARYTSIGVLHSFSGGHVELPAVPWARHHVPGQFPFSQRSAAMQAGIANRVKATADVGDSNRLARNLEFLNRSCRDLR